ncbi:hypothetical protein CJF30_00002124 [Rutstroemia sp. NJR-2017a BBW]|nr:hypothetical protein CJF30_00002124 [Rutstroemia sp. NJR-2017a BBW]
MSSQGLGRFIGILVEIRAAQRTFEGAYIRTALGQFSFALVVLKIFTAEFYSIGALFATYGAGVLMVSMYRRYEGNRQFFSEDQWKCGGGVDDFESGGIYAVDWVNNKARDVNPWVS